MNCYNGDRYLIKSLNSIFNQTYKNWELIFWNNKSTDRSKIIIKKFKDHRIKYFESQNLLNLYHARNLAIQVSKGDYICFLDTDDWWRKDKLEKQLNFFLENKNYKIVYGNFFNFNQKKKSQSLFYKKKLPEGRITQQLLNNYCIGILTAMINKSVFKHYKFSNRYNIIGDFDFFIKISLNYKIGNIQKPLAFYRIHSYNYSKLKLSLYYKEYIDWITINEKKLKKYNYSLFKLKITIAKIKVKKILTYFSSN